VRIKQLKGWPPSRFQAAEARGAFTPLSAASLELQTASLVPSVIPSDAPEVFLLLKCPETETMCSARFKVKDAKAAIRLAKALALCRGKSLGQIGDVEIREESDTFPWLKRIL
jgi:hypothetical protein